MHSTFRNHSYIHSINKNANGALRGALHRLYQGVLYFQNVMQFARYMCQLNFIYSHKKTTAFLRLYRVSQEECARLRESVPYVKLYRYNPKHLYPKLNGYGDNDHRKVWVSGVSTYCTPSVTPYSSTAHARKRDTTS